MRESEEILLMQVLLLVRVILFFCPFYTFGLRPGGQVGGSNPISKVRHHLAIVDRGKREKLRSLFHGASFGSL